MNTHTKSNQTKLRPLQSIGLQIYIQNKKYLFWISINFFSLSSAIPSPTAAPISKNQMNVLYIHSLYYSIRSHFLCSTQYLFLDIIFFSSTFVPFDLFVIRWFVAINIVALLLLWLMLAENFEALNIRYDELSHSGMSCRIRAANEHNSSKSMCVSELSMHHQLDPEKFLFIFYKQAYT